MATWPWLCPASGCQATLLPGATRCVAHSQGQQTQDNGISYSQAQDRPQTIKKGANGTHQPDSQLKLPKRTIYIPSVDSAEEKSRKKTGDAITVNTSPAPANEKKQLPAKHIARKTASRLGGGQSSPRTERSWNHDHRSSELDSTDSMSRPGKRPRLSTNSNAKEGESRATVSSAINFPRSHDSELHEPPRRESDAANGFGLRPEKTLGQELLFPSRTHDDKSRVPIIGDGETAARRERVNGGGQELRAPGTKIKEPVVIDLTADDEDYGGSAHRDRPPKPIVQFGQPRRPAPSSAEVQSHSEFKPPTRFIFRPPRKGPLTERRFEDERPEAPNRQPNLPAASSTNPSSPLSGNLNAPSPANSNSQSNRNMDQPFWSPAPASLAPRPRSAGQVVAQNHHQAVRDTQTGQLRTPPSHRPSLSHGPSYPTATEIPAVRPNANSALEDYRRQLETQERQQRAQVNRALGEKRHMDAQELQQLAQLDPPQWTPINRAVKEKKPMEAQERHQRAQANRSLEERRQPEAEERERLVRGNQALEEYRQLQAGERRQYEAEERQRLTQLDQAAEQKRRWEFRCQKRARTDQALPDHQRRMENQERQLRAFKDQVARENQVKRATEDRRLQAQLLEQAEQEGTGLEHTEGPLPVEDHLHVNPPKTPVERHSATGSPGNNHQRHVQEKASQVDRAPVSNGRALEGLQKSGSYVATASSSIPSSTETAKANRPRQKERETHNQGVNDSLPVQIEAKSNGSVNTESQTVSSSPTAQAIRDRSAPVAYRPAANATNGTVESSAVDPRSYSLPKPSTAPIAYEDFDPVNRPKKPVPKIPSPSVNRPTQPSTKVAQVLESPQPGPVTASVPEALSARATPSAPVSQPPKKALPVFDKPRQEGIAAHDPAKFDEYIYGPLNAPFRPGDPLFGQPATHAPKPATRFAAMDPRVRWTRRRSAQWHANKQAEIRARGGRKANFGQVAERKVESTATRGAARVQIPERVRQNPKWLAALDVMDRLAEPYYAMQRAKEAGRKKTGESSGDVVDGEGDAEMMDADDVRPTIEHTTTSPYRSAGYKRKGKGKATDCYPWVIDSLDEDPNVLGEDEDEDEDMDVSGWPS